MLVDFAEHQDSKPGYCTDFGRGKYLKNMPCLTMDVQNTDVPYSKVPSKKKVFHNFQYMFLGIISTKMCEFFFQQGKPLALNLCG